MVRSANLKPPFDDVDKEAVPWCLSWHADGRCDSFTKEAILACAPPISGVYGLFNFDCQIFIGEAANIQETLLRHESENDFPSPHLRPTGFTFEPCAPELRKPKAEELIAKYRPVLQVEASVIETRAASDRPMESEAALRENELNTPMDQEQFPAHGDETHPKVGRRFNLNRMQLAALATSIVMAVVLIFYFAMPGGENVQKQEKNASANSVAGLSSTPSSASGGAGVPLSTKDLPSTAPAGGSVHQSAEAIRAIPGVHASKPDPQDTVEAPEKTASVADEASTPVPLAPAKTATTTHSAKSPASSKKWSVQIYAAPTKDVADNLVRKLKADGYNGYVVQATVNGETYHRVRIGPFDARAEAESVRQSFAHQERYRDAYLARD